MSANLKNLKHLNFYIHRQGKPINTEVANLCFPFEVLSLLIPFKLSMDYYFSDDASKHFAEYISSLKSLESLEISRKALRNISAKVCTVMTTNVSKMKSLKYMSIEEKNDTITLKNCAGYTQKKVPTPYFQRIGDLQGLKKECKELMKEYLEMLLSLE